MNSLNDLASKIGLSAKNLMYLGLGLVVLWSLIGGAKRTYRRARRTVRSTANRYTAARRYKGASRTRALRTAVSRRRYVSPYATRRTRR